MTGLVRKPGPPPRVVGRGVNIYLPKLDAWLRKLLQYVADGIPAGWRNTPPNVISGATTASAGSQNAGWMAADATFELDTTSGSEADVSWTAASAEGAGPGVTLIGHTHRVLAQDTQNIIANQVFGD